MYISWAMYIYTVLYFISSDTYYGKQTNNTNQTDISSGYAYMYGQPQVCIYNYPFFFILTKLYCSFEAF